MFCVNWDPSEVSLSIGERKDLLSNDCHHCYFARGVYRIKRAKSKESIDLRTLQSGMAAPFHIRDHIFSQGSMSYAVVRKSIFL